MGMLDGLIEQLEKSPVVANAMVQFNSVRDILIKTVNRFDARFETAHQLQVAQSENMVVSSQAIARIEQKLDQLLSASGGVKPAGDDGLFASGLINASGSGEGYYKSFVSDATQPVTIVGHDSEIEHDLRASEPAPKVVEVDIPFH